MADYTTETSSTGKKKKNTHWFIPALIALLIGGSLGYVIGANMAKTESEEELQRQVASLEEELETAKEDLSDDIEEGQDSVAEGQDTIESLQAENATLKATIDQQNKKIADLEQQLEEAENSGTDETTQ